jgi:DNA-binding transcriptional LysR family regulator
VIIQGPAIFIARHVVPHLSSFTRKFPGTKVELLTTASAVELVPDNIDIAIHVGTLPDAPLAAHKIASCRRTFCASPAYLCKAGEPRSLQELEHHKLLIEEHGKWDLAGPNGKITLAPKSAFRINCPEAVRQAALSGEGIMLASIWHAGHDLTAGQLVPILPEFREAPDVAIFALSGLKDKPSAKSLLFIDHLAACYGVPPYWDEITEEGEPLRIGCSLQGIEA